MISYVIASQRVRPEVAGPMTSSAKQSSAQCKRPLDCFVASAPRNDARALVLAMHLHPSGGHASNEKPQKFSLSAPIFARRHRRWWPAPSRSMLQATNVSVRRKRKAERRKTLIRILRAPSSSSPACGGGQRRGRGSPFAKRARPSAFHRGSRQRESSSLRLSFRPGFRGRGLNGRYPPSPVPVQRAPRAPVIMPGD